MNLLDNPLAFVVGDAAASRKTVVYDPAPRTRPFNRGAKRGI
jgi:hypothetical protein